MTSSVHRIEPLALTLPLWRYAEMYAGTPWRFLLDSACDPSKLGGFSFVGGDPFLVFTAKRRLGAGPGAAATIRQWRPGHGWSEREAEPLAALRDLLEAYRVPLAPRPVPFIGGAVGWLGYEAGYFVEALPDRGVDDLGLPDICLMFVDTVIARDEASGRGYVSVIGRGADAGAAERNAGVAMTAAVTRIRDFEANPPAAWRGPPGSPRSDDAPRVALGQPFDRARYASLVAEAREHIFAGDAFEVCTSHRIDAPFPHPPWALYAELRRTNPAPFAAFIEAPGASVVSASPERFLRLDADGVIESRPIKGTRPRGDDAATDRALAEALATSTKDRAENVMIVDLVRNDLGRVARIGSVHVPELMIVESYATVHQLVSTVRARLAPERDAIDLLAACFPGGSMTGAPKVEAMKIIDALEPVKRGVYSGAIGYFDFAGPLDLSIVIRTLVVKDGRAYFSVGGAVVADSVPEDEYRETMDKARAVVRAIDNVERVLGR